MRKIVLLGYMGSGKSVVAQLLAQRLNLPCLDLDAMIEYESNATISQIFENQGEIKFRRLEHAIFKSLMQNEESFVLALGGGTPCYANNHEMFNLDGVSSIYLRTSIAVLIDRLSSEKAHRPVIANRNDDQMQEFIAKSLFERSYFYNQAQYKVTTDEKSPEEIVLEIEKALI